MIGSVLILVGFFFIFVATVGILRFPDFYTRAHAQGKSETLGVALVLLGIAVKTGFSLLSIKLLLILGFVMLANPTATHALGRSAYLSGLKPWKAKNKR